jgi:hypothetical protein
LKEKLGFENDHLFVALKNEIEFLIKVFKISVIEPKTSVQRSDFLIILSKIKIKRYSIPSFELESFLLLHLHTEILLKTIFIWKERGKFQAHLNIHRF